MNRAQSEEVLGFAFLEKHRMSGTAVTRSSDAVAIMRAVKWQRRGGYADAMVVHFGPASLLPCN